MRPAEAVAPDVVAYHATAMGAWAETMYVFLNQKQVIFVGVARYLVASSERITGAVAWANVVRRLDDK